MDSNIAQYSIDDKAYTVSTEGGPPFLFGEDEILSRKDTDNCFDQPWYPAGFTIAPLLDEEGFNRLIDGLTTVVGKIVGRILGKDGVPEGFTLNRYHHFIRTDQDHYKVVGITRDLFPEAFTFPLTKLIAQFESLLGMQLTDINPVNNTQCHVIIRINRPGSDDYNPPHKDIYEFWDAKNIVPQFINFWIPICGVTPESTLPLAPGSHLLPESQVLRTRESSMANGKQYRVRTVRSWNGQSDLIRPHVGDGNVLIFTPHIIHGLAHNGQPDSTRVSLEFRLYRRA